MNEIKQDIPLTDPPTYYIEIDDVSDNYDPREELKEGDKLMIMLIMTMTSHQCLKTLFKKAQHILKIIQQRVAAREKLLRDRMNFTLRSPKII